VATRRDRGAGAGRGHDIRGRWGRGHGGRQEKEESSLHFLIIIPPHGLPWGGFALTDGLPRGVLII
jgi:hypothetical protein